jgi:hypothetical protein
LHIEAAHSRQHCCSEAAFIVSREGAKKKGSREVQQFTFFVPYCSFFAPSRERKRA